MLATPCATSSTLDLWRLPIMPSATTAESSDSIPARRATVTAGEKSSRMPLERHGGQPGRRDGSPDLAEAGADRLDRQAQGRHERPRPTRIATIGAGTVRETFGQSSRIASDPAATAIAATETRAAGSRAYALHFARNGAGTAAIRRPSRSRICDEKMMTAIPLVKPVTTGYGMNLIAAPKRARPRIDEEDAGEQRADRQAVDAVARDDSGDDHRRRPPSGPPIWTRLPPRNEMRKPATAAVTRPRSGGTPEAIAKAIASGMATIPTTTPAWRSARNWRRE